jgi:hypothetical protein
MGIDLSVRFTPETLRQAIIASSLPLIENVPPGTGTTNRLVVNGQTSVQPHVFLGPNAPAASAAPAAR